MIKPRPTFVLLAFAALTFAVTAASCADEEVFIDCPLSNSIEASCTSLDETVAFTCVVESHPFCLDKICASWEGSRSFCTQSCTVDGDDCPESSSCQTSLDISFCVPDEEIP